MSAADVNRHALMMATMAVEKTLVEFRESRMSMLDGANGFVIREPDGGESSVIRLTTVDGLRIGIRAYLEALSMSEVEIRAAIEAYVTEHST